MATTLLMDISITLINNLDYRLITFAKSTKDCYNNVTRVLQRDLQEYSGFADVHIVEENMCGLADIYEGYSSKSASIINFAGVIDKGYLRKPKRLQILQKSSHCGLNCIRLDSYPYLYVLHQKESIFPYYMFFFGHNVRNIVPRIPHVLDNLYIAEIPIQSSGAVYIDNDFKDFKNYTLLKTDTSFVIW